jgi:hypothetical protein
LLERISGTGKCVSSAVISKKLKTNNEIKRGNLDFPIIGFSFSVFSEN